MDYSELGAAYYSRERASRREGQGAKNPETTIAARLVALA